MAAPSLTSVGLRGVHTVGGGVIWTSGANGTVLRSEDDGFEWQACAVPPGAESLDFRAVWGFSNNHAFVLSSGPGNQSRVYETKDGCSSWKLVLQNPDQDGFFDGLVFRNPREGFILGDPVRGRFTVLSTNSGGARWQRSENTSLRVSTPQEGGFAASNSLLILLPPGQTPLFATGGPGGGRVFRYTNQGDWAVTTTPLAGAAVSAGIFSVAFRDRQHGIAVGGDYEHPDSTQKTAAWTADGGKTWTAAAKPPSGYRSAVAWLATQSMWIAVGTNGTDVSLDDGRSWTRIGSGPWNALSLPWAVGPGGKIGRLDENALLPAGKSRHKRPAR